MQQEPKITADLSNDEQFIKDCASGKDAYATIASIAFNKPYEDCLEFYLDENGQKTHRVNKEGKARRSQAKIILLGEHNPILANQKHTPQYEAIYIENCVNSITQRCA